jgi:hypothetical protein
MLLNDGRSYPKIRSKSVAHFVARHVSIRDH